MCPHHSFPKLFEVPLTQTIFKIILNTLLHRILKSAHVHCVLEAKTVQKWSSWRSYYIWIYWYFELRAKNRLPQFIFNLVLPIQGEYDKRKCRRRLIIFEMLTGCLSSFTIYTACRKNLCSMTFYIGILYVKLQAYLKFWIHTELPFACCFSNS